MVRFSRRLAEAVAADKRLAEYYFEHPEGGWHPDDNVAVHWVRTASGWCVESQGMHLANGCTVADVYEQLRAIEPCHCAECAPPTA